MKTRLTLAIVTVIGALALAANAQDNTPPNDGPPSVGPGGQRGPGLGQRPPLPAVMRALDANHDSVIDADEINNAPAALRSLDKNGDGKLTFDEAMGPRPQMRGPQGGHGGQGRGPGGPDGLGGDNNQPPMGPPPGKQ